LRAYSAQHSSDWEVNYATTNKAAL